MNKMKKLLVLALAGTMVFSLAGCGGGGGGDAKVKDDGVIDVCFASEPATIDPALNSSVDGAIMCNHIFEGLYTWKDDGKGNAELTEGAAEKCEVSEDGTVYTFTIRKDAKWSDGEPVTAKDFLYAWNRVADPATAADYSYMLDPVKGFDSTVEGETHPEIEAPDDHTFIVKLDVPTEYFKEVCAFPALFPVRQDIIEAKGDKWTYEPDTYVGNGPYKMTEWSHNEFIAMEKSETYHNADAVVAEKLKFHLMDDVNAMLAGFKSGELDFIQQLPAEEVEALLADGTAKNEDYLGNYYVCFNTSDNYDPENPFLDPNVRKAFNLVIDRNFICDQVKKDGSVPATGFVPTGMYDAGGAGTDFREVGGDYFSADADKYEANCEEARKLLADAGYPEGKGFPQVEYLYNTDKGHKAIGEALQNMWKEQLGITVTLRNQDWNVFLEERKDGKFHIARGGWIADYNDPMCFLDLFITGSGNNDPQYANPEFDKLIGEAKVTADNNKRMEIMHKAEDLLVGEESVVAPIYYYAQVDASKVDGVYYTPLGYYFFNGATFK